MSQLSLLEPPAQTDNTVLPWRHIPQYLSAKQQQLLRAEAASYPFERPTLTVFGKQHLIPREQAWFADAGCNYLYSGLMICAQPWPHYLSRLRQQLEREFNQPFNGVLVNHYRDGQDKMGWHSDDEPEMVAGSLVISLSIGAARDFDIRHKQRPERHRIPLASGDMLVMQPAMQQHWQHSLPQRKKIASDRLNLTFRQLIPFYHQQ
ncbi:alpha-ketoglutarate-dependent dioxygenase AlkB [Shewanella sp. C32]|uniref:Alpha-ketoglutarate-dependent dioxygenase AlkB n=1 Tax=Shewanella electrica TaxID=515560 RepID=A0ABT2FFN4_9GAMM|nr:alpha-ketoglutarate-dependent dioxygenase AlkB [Shewanella electrica]MCH1925278.1 alpha-ketoglutarate-dependent dioxygenase AlkB [Shewanella electrica]MCS4555103.1 alpha-ketoglutarate-dependent dioxygenase AlkB [Shewanella electrica]